MSSSIFLIGNDNRLTQMTRADYHSEDLFQSLLANHPALLGLAAGDENGLLLVRRELAVPDREFGAERWLLDHLFLDRRGVPVLVEVKRSSDTRARREVVAQMLDYAANGVTYWPLDRIIAAFTESCIASGEDPDARLAEFIGDESSESFWRQVESNLRSGRIKMVFVADRIPKELLRIVEFLNEQMRFAEVLAIEVEQFVNSDGLRTLVPRLLGDTQRAQTTKSVTSAATPISEAEWLAQLEAGYGANARQAADKAIKWLGKNGFTVGITNSQNSIFANVLRPTGKVSWPVFLSKKNGNFAISFRYLKFDPAFADDSKRREILDRLRALPGVAIGNATVNGWPSIALAEIGRDDVWEPLQNILLDIRFKISAGTG